MHRLNLVLDTIVTSTAIVATGTAALMSEPTHNSIEMQLLLLPLIGALIVSGGLIMLNPQPETRRIVIGRGIFAMFFGVLVPQLIGMMHPALETVSIKPAVLLFGGGIISGLAYVLSRPFTKELYARAEGVAKKEADRLEEKYSPVPNVTVNHFSSPEPKAPNADQG